MNVDECISAYNELMESIFSKRENLSPVDMQFRFKPRYNSDKLREAIEKVLKRQGSPVDAPLHHNDDEDNTSTTSARCKV